MECKRNRLLTVATAMLTTMFSVALGGIIVSLQARQLPSKPELLGELAELCDCGQRTLALAVLPQVGWLGGWEGWAARPHNRWYSPGTPCGGII